MVLARAPVQALGLKPWSQRVKLTCVLHCLAGYWNVTVYGRKHCYRLYTKLLNEATRWSSAIQNVTDNKAPIDTPTQQLIQDIKVRREVPEPLMKSSLGRKISPAQFSLVLPVFS